MATKSKTWPVEIADWPANQSNAAKDRDDAAMCAAQISKYARAGHKLVSSGQYTREHMLHLLAQIEWNASDILRLMERNGAPTRPYQNGHQ